jgi:hypothetical protein
LASDPEQDNDEDNAYSERVDQAFVDEVRDEAQLHQDRLL